MAVNLINGNDTQIVKTNDDIQVEFSQSRGQQITEMENQLATIIESGSNGNGNYIKFNDGTMICYGFRTNTITNNRTQVGGMWYTNQIDLGNFPVSFVEMPTIILHNLGVFAILEHTDTSSQNVGKVYMGNGTQRTNVEQKTMFAAIGKWK